VLVGLWVGAVVHAQIDANSNVGGRPGEPAEANGALFDKLKEANSSWLVCIDRADYSWISYDMELSRTGVPTRTFHSAGRYDRGAFLLLPSEYVLYRSNPQGIYIVDGEEHIKVVVPIRRKNTPPYGIPDYQFWASMLGIRPLSWQAPDRIRFLLKELDESDHHYGYELLFSKKDYRLLKETVIGQGAVENAQRGQEVEPKQQVDAVAEVSYSYADYGNYPTEATLFNRNVGLRARLKFQVVDGFWMLREGVIMPLEAGEKNQPDPAENWVVRILNVTVAK